MASTMKRVVYTLASVAVGVGVVYGLTMASEQTKGPIETVLTKVQSTVQHVEQEVILDKRPEKRSDKLKWLDDYRNNMAKLKHPRQMLLGAFDNNSIKSFQPVIDLEDTLKTTFPFIHIYKAWGSKDEHRFPKREAEDIRELGSIPVITWEPWLTAFDQESFPALKSMETRDKEGLKDVAAGAYDTYLKQWAIQAKRFASPILLRLGHEMNDPYRYPWGPQNNKAAGFVQAWQHVHQLFREAGASNVIWIWSPHPAYGYFKDYYPGDEYVDYVGVGTLNYGPIASWSKWWTFDEIFGKFYNDLASFNKPIMLSEFASLSYGGNRAKWYADALKDMPQKYSLVKSILFFHFDADKTTTQQVLDWNIINDRAVVHSVVTQVNNWHDSLKAGNKK